MKTLIKLWWNQPAFWWQWWLPNSGYFGGVIAGALAYACLIIVGRLVLHP